MESIIKFCVSRQITISMIWLALSLFGAIALQKIKMNLMPELKFPKVTVIVNYPNASPEEIESLITKPIADSVGTIGGLDKINSESVEGMSLITLQFSNSITVDYAIIEVRERIDLIRDFLPQDASRPIVTRFDPSQSAFQEIVFFPGKDMDEKKLRGFIQDNVKVHLEKIEGLAAVQFSGGFQKEISVEIDPDKMNAYGISLLDVRRSIVAANVNFPAGSLPVGKKDLLIRAIGEFQNAAEIGQTIAGTNTQGVPVDIASFASIKEGYKERTGIARYNGKDCIIAYLFKESGKNSVEISDKVQSELASINERFRRELKAEIVFDESKYIKEAISGVSGSLISGAILAFLVLVFLLRNVKSPLILLTVIPASLFTTLLLFYLFNISLNMMSLGGLALGIGMLFDTSNVVFSAIERNLSRGAEIKKAALNGTMEVTGSVISATLTTVIVFLPIIFLKSIVGIVFAEMALAITISLVISLIASLTIIPMLSSVLYTINMESEFLNKLIFNRSEKIYLNMLKSYENRLNHYLDHPFKLIVIIVVLFVFSIQFISVVSKEFIPHVDTGEFSIIIEAPKGSKLEATSEIVSNIESTLLKSEPVASVISRIGYEEDQLASKKKGEWGTNRATLRVLLKDRANISTTKFINEIRNKIALGEDIKIIFENSGDVLSSLITSDQSKLTLEIHGDDLKTLHEIGANLAKKISSIAGVKDVRESMEDKSIEYALSFDPIKSSSIHMTNEYMSNYLRIANHGSIVTKIKIANKNVNVRLSFRKQDVDSLEKVMRLNVKAPSGELIQIAQISKVEEKVAPTSILRSGNSRINLVMADINPVLMNSAISNAEEVVAKFPIPEGYKIQFSGEKENIEKSFSDLSFAFVLAAVLIYMLLASQFESLLYSLVMICTIPLMFIGTFPALFLFGKSLNVSSFMGIVLLLGVVVDNAALYYEYVQLLFKENIPLKKIIVDSGKIVLRPILMNNSTTILGLMPIMLELQKGTEFQSPMAVVVVIGLFASFFFSLYLIPLLFYYLLKNER
ncbi:RND transporter, Hydrophobe/Amphiphile Efflux-1 (HAE1)/Heavy Metal Efflux (HME) family, permease protein [Leptospira inadai serovar Lyme str. 10]|uniref:RND transporter, Hydrophobe/Amphiphile Efflux-1 (HAE1)/Heavy Metal Efflux (HME) family, permease protein n=2 Tax=Leptospira inadai serovar Lyme TaxID=293084 RepID=V6HWH1_9LEPT|nr:efflux RND transporter permease subunit [Leptospira inadai]EQA37294.1 RND transporter, Hydrophobe/Amphiphile Efflux-1 (HAE1)/Heavy Metal Efflux (HME) family, permease protein [Leptospira inadai serovar Lyme str. 10]PNV76520.1 acriflavin resistance protein [Leptospira inadai serovar Lyme]